jgi:hypothetical protein
MSSIMKSCWGGQIRLPARHRAVLQGTEPGWISVKVDDPDLIVGVVLYNQAVRGVEEHLARCPQWQLDHRVGRPLLQRLPGRLMGVSLHLAPTDAKEHPHGGQELEGLGMQRVARLCRRCR